MAYLCFRQWEGNILSCTKYTDSCKKFSLFIHWLPHNSAFLKITHVWSCDLCMTYCDVTCCVCCWRKSWPFCSCMTIPYKRRCVNWGIPKTSPGEIMLKKLCSIFFCPREGRGWKWTAIANIYLFQIFLWREANGWYC